MKDYVVRGALVLALVFPLSAAAQFRGTADFGTGPAAWDQVEQRDQLLNGALGAAYRLSGLMGLEPELLGDFGLSARPADRAAMGWDVGARFHTRGADEAWLGARIGAAGIGSRQKALTTLEGGVRPALGPAGIDLWGSGTGFGSRIAPTGGFAGDTAQPDTLVRGGGVAAYVELGSRAALRVSRYEVGLS